MGSILTALSGCGANNHPVKPSGTFEAVEVNVASTLAGRLLDVRPQLGGMVITGDTLAVIEADLLCLQRVQTQVGLSALQAQRAIVQNARKQAERSLQFSQTTLDRISSLSEQGSATAQQSDEAQFKRDLAELQVAGADRQLEALAAEEARLAAALAVIDRQIKESVILAPVDGTVLLRAVEPGEIAQPGVVLLRLADMTRLELRIYLAASELNLVKIGQNVRILVDAFPNSTSSGDVVWISSEAEFTPKNAQTKEARTQLVYAVKIRVLNPERRLAIGMNAEVEL